MHTSIVGAFIPLLHVAAAWSTDSYTSTVTRTYRDQTVTRTGTELTFSDTTITVPGTTATIDAGTSVTTITSQSLAIPSQIYSAIFRPGLSVSDEARLQQVIIAFGRDLTSISPASISRVLSEVESVYSSYSSVTTRPAIITKAPQDVRAVLGTDVGLRGGIRGSRYETALGLLNPYIDEKYQAQLSSLLAPWPAVQSEAAEYYTVAASYYAPIVIAEASIARDVLSVTNPNPELLSRVSRFLPSNTSGSTDSVTTTTDSTSASTTDSTSASTSTSAIGSPTTSSSNAGAVATGRAEVLFNAGVAAAGMAVIALM